MAVKVITSHEYHSAGNHEDAGPASTLFPRPSRVGKRWSRTGTASIGGWTGFQVAGTCLFPVNVVHG